MTHHGVKFVRSEVKNLQKQGEDQRLVSFTDSAIPDEVFDTVLLAIGRVPNTHDIGIDKIGVKTHKSSTKVIADDLDKTSVDNVYAIGDAVQGIFKVFMHEKLEYLIGYCWIIIIHLQEEWN